MIQYPATPFVYEAFVSEVKEEHGKTSVRLMLPGFGPKLYYLGDVADLLVRSHACAKLARECVRDIAYHVFGEDWRWFEASMPPKDKKRMWLVLSRKLMEAIKDAKPGVKSARA